MGVFPHIHLRANHFFNVLQKLQYYCKKKNLKGDSNIFSCWLLGKCFLRCDSKIIRLKTIVDLP